MIEFLVRIVSLICGRDPKRTHLALLRVGLDAPATRDAIMAHCQARTEQ